MLGTKFFELQSGALFLEILFACFMFGIYILREIKYHGWNRMRLQGTFAVFVFMAGESIIRGWVWWWRRLIRLGEDPSWMNNHPILFLGASLTLVGVVLIIRVFAPDHWNKNIWWGSVVVSIGIAGIGVYYN